MQQCRAQTRRVPPRAVSDTATLATASCAGLQPSRGRRACGPHASPAPSLECEGARARPARDQFPAKHTGYCLRLTFLQSSWAGWRAEHKEHIFRGVS